MWIMIGLVIAVIVLALILYIVLGPLKDYYVGDE